MNWLIPPPRTLTRDPATGRFAMEMKVSFFIPPTVGPKEELYKRMAGRRTDLYQTMLKNLVEIEVTDHVKVVRHGN